MIQLLRQGQRQRSQEGPTVADVIMEVSVPGMPQQTLHLRLRPGVPASLSLVPGHLWVQVRTSTCCHHRHRCHHRAPVDEISRNLY